MLKDAKLALPSKPQLILITDPTFEPDLPDTVSALRATHHAARIVIFVDTHNCAHLEAAMELQAHAYLCNRIKSQALVSALDVVLGDSGVLSMDFVSRFITRPSGPPAVKPVDDGSHTRAPCQSWPLSNREVDILKCLTDGASNKLIARQFDIAESTVKIHVKGILRKINVRNRTQAAIWALANYPSDNAALSSAEHY
ncbi:hypothetical protein GCM10007884_27460 [Methylobacterium brachythecii]|uniref:HTH luxR-type domain-containing protein n=1 Tax=Methylobacterium brachythecii TaxID=1176177 RepID=A0ABQ6D348_9HYPH|nr:hypothetical protein GCM10007884_27460 [Methylobacterium brachythecii]